MGSGQFQFLSQIICCRNSRNTIWTKSHKIAIVGEDEGRFSPVDTLRSENNLWMTRRPLVIDASPLTGEPAARGGGADSAAVTPLKARGSEKFIMTTIKIK